MTDSQTVLHYCTMKPYHQSSTYDDLEALPDLKSSPGYEVIDGNPKTYMRMDQGNADSKHRLGIWCCTPGSFRCVEKGDELQTLLEGSLTLIYDDGSEHHFGPGDSIYTEKGERVIWKIHETVKKVFFTHDSNGTD